MKFRETTLFQQARRLFLLFDYLLWLFIDPSKFNKIEHAKIKKILVIHLGAIGEILSITSLISSLKKKLNCDIEIIVEKGKEFAIKDNPHISKVLIYQNSFKKNLNKIQKKNFDLAVIVNPASFKIAFLCLRAGIKYRIGGFSGLKRFPTILFTRRSFPVCKKHAIETSLDIIRQINIDNPQPKIEFYYSKKTKKSVEQKLKKLKVKEYVIIHPCFNKKDKLHSFRLWPARRYSKVIDYLNKNYDFDILLTGTQEETEFAKEIFNGVTNKKKVRLTNGLFRFDELGVVISKAKLLIAPGTSIVHLASSFNIPIVNLIPQQRDLYEWYPWMKKDRYKIFFSNKMNFNPNVPKEFANEGMFGITVDDIIKATESLLKRHYV